MKINEYQLIEGVAEEHVFRGCKLLGKTSRNGYSYSEAAVTKATSMYVSAPVFIDHAKGSRSYADRVGSIQNPRVTDGDLYGDFVLNPHHKLAEQILWDAKTGTTGVGFSHSIEGKMSKDKKIVESIDKVFSVDLVASPATCDSFFESVQETEIQADATMKLLESHTTEMAETKKLIDSLTQSINEIKATLDSMKKIKPIAIAPQPQKAHDSYGEFLKKIKV